MSSLKNAFVAGMFAVSGAVSAQHADTTVVDTKQSLYTIVSDSTQTNPVDATTNTEYGNPVAPSKNTMPTFQNPREGSLIHQLQNNWLTEWYYSYKQNGYVQVKFKQEGKYTRIVVKLYYTVDQSDPYGWFYVRDRIVLDQYGHYLPRNPYSSDEAWSLQSFLVSTPLSYIGDNRPALQSQMEVVQ